MDKNYWKYRSSNHVLFEHGGGGGEIYIGHSYNFYQFGVLPKVLDFGTTNLYYIRSECVCVCKCVGGGGGVQSEREILFIIYFGTLAPL